MIDEPTRHFAHGHAVTHDHLGRADKAFLPRAQECALDRAARGVGPIKDPYNLVRARCFLEQVKQRRHEGVDAAAEVLQVEQEDIGAVHHPLGRAAHFAIKAEDGNAVLRVDLVAGLDHVVLLVPLQPVLRPESRSDVHFAGNQGVERVHEPRSDRCRMGHQRDTAPVEALAQIFFGDEPIDAEFHDALGAASRAVKQAGSWKSGASPPCASAQ